MLAKVTSLGMVTWPGVELALRPVSVPLPSSPELLTPHAHALPLVSSARLKLAPAAIALKLTPAGMVTATGTSLSVWSPSPNWPYWLYPHAQALPAVSNARLCWPSLLAAMAVKVTPDGMVTATGTGL